MEKVKSNINIINREDCYGCGACAAICPFGAIKMVVNNDGFLFPQVDSKKCNHCGLCTKVCPIFNNKLLQLPEPEIYALWSKYPNIRLLSSSGGVAFSIGLHLLEKGYFILGVSFSKDFRKVKHILVKHSSSLFSTIGSKYIQSNLSNALRETLALKNKKILVIGTPCQIQGIRNILKEKNLEENYYLIDFFCHGVPSYYLWWSFLDKVTSKIGNPLHIEFRFKGRGWQKYQFRAIGQEKIYLKEFSKTLFGRFYLNNYFFRESCYSCKLSGKNSAADLRIGDFWGPFFSSDFMGVSIGIPYTEKGLELVEICHDLQVRSMPLRSAAGLNSRYYGHVYKPSNNEAAFEELKGGRNLNSIYQKFLSSKYIKNAIRTLPVKTVKVISPPSLLTLVKKIKKLIKGASL